MSFLNQKEIEKIVTIALEAGEIAKKYFFSQEFKIQKKPDNSKVTDADLEISAFIGKKLKNLFPKIPLVCEEGNLREFEEENFWLVDPIDGTSSFIDGNDQFAICIALVKKDQPIFGLIYAPLYEGGQMIYSNSKDQVILSSNDHEKILTPVKGDDKMFRVVTSPRAQESDIDKFIKQFYENTGKEIIIERISSAIKFIHLLEGKADIYLHFRKSMEWDIAAGHALLKNINGKVKKLSFNEGKFLIGEEMTYKKSGFLNQFFIANF